MSGTPLLSEYIMEQKRMSDHTMDNANFVQCQDPRAHQYASRIPNERLANMARISQLLRNNGLHELQQQAVDMDHNVPCHRQPMNHNALMRPPSSNDMSMSSDSSLDIQSLHSRNHLHANVMVLDNRQKGMQQHRDTTGLCNPVSGNKRSLSMRKPVKHPSNSSSMSMENLALMGSCGFHQHFVSPFTKFSRERATFHGGHGPVNPVFSAQLPVDNQVSLPRAKEDMVMGKAIVKLTVYVNSGMLTVHVVQAKHLHSQLSDLCNSHIKVSLVPDCEKRTKCGTSFVSQTNHPTFDDKFSFELLEGDCSKRLLVSVWHKHQVEATSSEFLGCMSFGVSNILKADRTVNGWYYLLKEDVGRRKHLQAIKKGQGQSLKVTEVNKNIVL